MTVSSARCGPADTRRPGAHSLLVAETDRERRVRTAAWVDEQLADGAKVYYQGRLDDPDATGAADAHWLTGTPGAARAADALRSGQLEVLDLTTTVERAGGTVRGFRDLQAGQVLRALHQGWPRVAMSQETPRLPMADDTEAATFAALEAGFDDFAQRWPLTTLCQLTVAEENRAATWESAAVHHHRILDGQWSAQMAGSRWCVRGELDAHVVQRFGAALYGALRERRDARDGPDLDLDLVGVDFLDLACAQSLALTVRSAGRHQRVVVHGADPFVRHVLHTAGCPAAVVFAEEVGHGEVGHGEVGHGEVGHGE